MKICIDTDEYDLIPKHTKKYAIYAIYAGHNKVTTSNDKHGLRQICKFVNQFNGDTCWVGLNKPL